MKNDDEFVKINKKESLKRVDKSKNYIIDFDGLDYLKDLKDLKDPKDNYSSLKKIMNELYEDQCSSCGEKTHSGNRNGQIHHLYYIDKATGRFTSDLNAINLKKVHREQQENYPKWAITLLCSDCHAGQPSSYTCLTPNHGYEIKSKAKARHCENILSNNKKCGEPTKSKSSHNIIENKEIGHSLVACAKCEKVKCKKVKLPKRIALINHLDSSAGHHFKEIFKIDDPLYIGQFPEYDITTPGNNLSQKFGPNHKFFFSKENPPYYSFLEKGFFQYRWYGDLDCSFKNNPKYDKENYFEGISRNDFKRILDAYLKAINQIGELNTFSLSSYRQINSDN